MSKGRPAWGRFLDDLDGGAREEERRLSLVSRFEGGRRSQPYRCSHLVVAAGGTSCFICGLELEGTSWHEEWLETGIQSPSRPMPVEFGIGRVTL